MDRQSPNHRFSRSSLIFLLYFPLFFSRIGALRNRKASNSSSVSALLVFGDSTVDAGNNNFVPTIFRSNFPPYGRDFPFQIPTGRFSNGRLSTDFIASYLGVKEYVPPYLDPTLSIPELMTGVSFASAGSGFDPLTPKVGNVVSISTQVEYFKEYKQRLEAAIGKQRTKNHIKNTVFFISAGTNDFVITYFTSPLRRKTFTLSAYQQFIIQQITQFFQALWAEGARRFVMPGLAPMGCLPVVITLYSSNAILDRGCLDRYSAVARDFNALLQSELLSLQNRLSQKSPTFIGYIDTYGRIIEMIHGVGKYGFDKVDVGCCGSGYLEMSLMCNFKSPVCPDAGRYVFWDAIHPTEKAYYNLFQAGIPALEYITADLR
ncbi:GDSL esterase/lipase At5g45960-like [Momordica charantia]|uniref:GDSL esterase/lipase At5g45960-like n=1 Tax=Momordica charantia TaxID=3673 RepID=A0A6J1CFV3_MOMCH|nr:GDSL esterase/lipase At5g45960-like [Momordica charantia]